MSLLSISTTGRFGYLLLLGLLPTALGLAVPVQAWGQADSTEPPKVEEPSEAKPEAPEAEKPAEEKPKAEPAKPMVLKPIVPKDYLLLPKIGVYGRAATHIDAVDAAFVQGNWKMPKEDDTLQLRGDRTVRWKAATIDAEGNLSTRSAAGGYAATQIESPIESVWLLEAKGHAAVYVNGEPHAGDPYALGGWRLPVNLRKGTNELVFHVAQPQLHVRLISPSADMLLSTDLTTLPTVVRGQGEQLWGSLPVLNTSNHPLVDAKLVAQVADGKQIETPVAWLDGASVRNVPFKFQAPKNLQGKQVELQVRLVVKKKTVAEAKLSLEVVEALGMQVRTFRSRIDQSVQSYAVLPATGKNPKKGKPGLILALHGAGESARDFASHYQPKAWAHVVAPTGRGLYGFDWEEWARTDALEALDDAMLHWPVDPQRLYVTGHAMGAHGALVLAASQPDRFAAVGTSGAWSSLWDYGGGMPKHRDPTSVQAMLSRTASQSDTLQFFSNLQSTGVYLQHGEKNRQVPLDQSRLIVAELAKTHGDFHFHVEPNVGNWWGNATVDSPAMMDFFASRHRHPAVPSEVSLTTANLGVNATSHWVTIAGQQQEFAISRVSLKRRGTPLSITGTTHNVSRLSIDKSAIDKKGQPFVIRLDNSKPLGFRSMPAQGRIWLEKRGKQWRRVTAPKSSDKGPTRYGGFKAVFDNRPLLIYGTSGAPEENAWSRAKARFDAESFAYRGNGALEVIPDTEFNAKDDRDRNVVLYGNVDTNRAWPVLLSTSPVRAFRHRIEVATRPESGDDLGFLFVQPRPGSNRALVGGVGGTSLRGMRLTSRLRYFVSGVAYPDLFIFGEKTLKVGDSDVRAAGFFNADWSANQADIAWRDMAL